MAITRVPVDQTNWVDLLLYTVEDKMTRDEGQQTDYDNRNLYSVSVVVAQYKDEDGKMSGKPETMVVTVPGEVAGQAKKPPLDGVAPFTSIRFQDLYASQWSIDGRAGLSFRASGVSTSLQPASARRSDS